MNLQSLFHFFEGLHALALDGVAYHIQLVRNLSICHVQEVGQQENVTLFTRQFGQCLSQAIIVYGDGIALHIELRIVGRILIQYVSPIDLLLGQLRKGYLMLRTPCNMLRIITCFFAYRRNT